MWYRAELKEWAKAALRRNYWKIVLVSALLLLLGCGAGGYTFNATFHSGTNGSSGQWTDEQEDRMEQGARMAGNIISMSSSQGAGTSFFEDAMIGVIVAVIFLVIFLVVFAVVMCADIFLLNPLSVGGSRFMVKSVVDEAQVREIAYGFDHSYKNIVKVLFFRDLYIFLWALLFIIPGIVKMYQYYMVPYILTEYPDMEYKAVLQMSRDMMEGNKWKTFVLGLSFILWDFLGAATFGIVTVLYVQPYRQLTFAALYCRLRNIPVMNPAEPPVYDGNFGNGYENGQQ